MVERPPGMTNGLQTAAIVLVVTDVVRRGEAGRHSDGTDPEHEERSGLADQHNDDRREYEEANIHDVRQGHDQGLIAL
jgi:hypothetical protein